ncbi:lipoprotein [Streptomyces aureoverticillatus]|nr:lipoprotein [Streptomyces aureoverticillatus]
MTSLVHRSARRRRTVAALGAVSAGLLVLSACDKPTPLATVTVGSKSVHTEASCYNDGDELEQSAVEKCLKDMKDVKSITVDPDEKVRFGVDPEIADKGWTLLMNGQPLTEASKKTYVVIPGSVFFNQQYGGGGKSTTVSLLEGGKAKGGAKATGLWSFKFKKDSDA